MFTPKKWGDWIPDGRCTSWTRRSSPLMVCRISTWFTRFFHWECFKSVLIPLWHRMVAISKDWRLNEPHVSRHVISTMNSCRDSWCPNSIFRNDATVGTTLCELPCPLLQDTFWNYISREDLPQGFYPWLSKIALWSSYWHDHQKASLQGITYDNTIYTIYNIYTTNSYPKVVLSSVTGFARPRNMQYYCYYYIYGYLHDKRDFFAYSSIHNYTAYILPGLDMFYRMIVTRGVDVS